MFDDREKSLGDAATFDGQSKRPPASDVSLGDERTLGDNCSGQDTAIDDIEVVDLEARYKVERTLGQGGMGAVLLATDTRLDRKVAIKRILGDAAGNAIAVQRFLTEAKAIAALNHPNVVQIYDYGRAKDGPFLIMEYVDGGSLLDRCRLSALPLEEAIDLACQLCDGLAKAHDLGIIHRDIKPANVLLTKDGVPKLTDFGLAKAQASDHGQTMTGAVLGTPDFMPPEQRRDASEVDARSDLWSLAATIYQVLTGRSPKIVRLHEVPQAMQAVLAKALEDEKRDRYQSAVDLRAAIRSATEKPAHRPVTTANDLAAGECPNCHEPNEAHRKFCRNADCAAPLRVSCLATACSHEIPVWDRVCPECGAKQAELIAAMSLKYMEQQEAAEGFLAQYDFAAATQIAASQQAIADVRLKDFAAWSHSFLERVSREETAARDLRQSRIRDAAAHRAAFDYVAAIRSLESIPEPLRSGQPAEMLTGIREDYDKSRQLLNTIRHRIATRQLDGLLDVAKKALVLCGDQPDLRKLIDQLAERETRLQAQADEALQAAHQLLEVGNAKAALDRVNTHILRLSNQQEFLTCLRAAVTEEDRLSRLLTDAKSDGTITADEVVMLATQVVKVLALNPNHARINSLRTQLLARMDASPGDYVRRWRDVALFLASFNVPPLPEAIPRLRAARAKLEANPAALSQSAREQLEIFVDSRESSQWVNCPLCWFQMRAGELLPHFDSGECARNRD